MSAQTPFYEDPPCPAATGDWFGPPPPPDIEEPPPDDEDTQPAAARVITDEMLADLEAYRRIYRLPGHPVYIELPPFLDGR
jgi:hypothetical protein